MKSGKIEVRRTATFNRWLDRLKDKEARGVIAARLLRLADGCWGDARSVGDSVFELRIMLGPGYRLYGTMVGETVVLLLCGGDKGSQERDVGRAKGLAKRLRKEGS